MKLFDIHVFAVILFAFFLCCHVYRLVFDFALAKRKPGGLRSLAWLFATTFMMGAITTPLSLAADGVNWNGQEHLCSPLWTTISIFFVLTKVATYNFLWVRADLVQESLSLLSFSSKLLRWGTLALVNGAPIFIIPITASYVGSKVVPEGPCVFFATSIFPFIFFACADLALNLLLLLLFIVPLVMHLDQLHDENGKLLRVMRLNLIVFLICAASTLGSFSATAVMVTFAVGATPPPNDEYLQIYSVYPPSIDAIICVLAMHALSKVWVPKPMANVIKRIRARFGNFILSSSKSAPKDAALVSPGEVLVPVPHRQVATLDLNSSYVSSTKN